MRLHESHKADMGKKKELKKKRSIPIAIYLQTREACSRSIHPPIMHFIAKAKLKMQNAYLEIPCPVMQKTNCLDFFRQKTP